MNRRIVTAGPGLHIGDYVLAQTFNRDRPINQRPPILEGRCMEKIRVAGKDMAVAQELEKTNSCVANAVDISWLPFAAERYQISPDISDYILIPDIPLVLSGFPNRNLDCFTFGELTKWRTMGGCPSYASLRYRPVHVDHDNADDTKARGIILDVVMGKRFGKWHAIVLKAIDRSKEPKLANMVLNKRGAGIGHSMGALVEKTECSICGYKSDGVTTCRCIAGGAGKGQIINNVLCYEILRDYLFVESSIILGEQASPTALSSGLLDL